MNEDTKAVQQRIEKEIKKSVEDQRQAVKEASESVRESEEELREARGKELTPMVARYFDKDGEEIKEESVEWKLGKDAFRFGSVGDAKALGRRINAKGFRIWLGQEAEQDPDSPSLLFYIRTDEKSRYQPVNENGFTRYFENLIHAGIRRRNIQLLRSTNDPAYKEPEEYRIPPDLKLVQGGTENA